MDHNKERSRSPGTLGAGPTGASEPGRRSTPGPTLRGLSAAIGLPSRRVVAWLPNRALARPGRSRRAERDDEGDGEKDGCAHGEPPVLPVIKLS